MFRELRIEVPELAWALACGEHLDSGEQSEQLSKRASPATPPGADSAVHPATGRALGICLIYPNYPSFWLYYCQVSSLILPCQHFQLTDTIHTQAENLSTRTTLC